MRPADLPAAIHVQSLRLASGNEALVARVVERDGAVGLGFTLNLEAHVARELASWDARARQSGVPLFSLLGAAEARNVEVLLDAQPAFAPDREALGRALRERRIERLLVDPWAWGGIRPARRAAALAASSGIEAAFVAPHAHPWEIAVCAALAAAHPGPATVAAVAANAAAIAVPQLRGLGVDWAAEPAFAGLVW